MASKSQIIDYLEGKPSSVYTEDAATEMYWLSLVAISVLAPIVAAFVGPEGGVFYIFGVIAALPALQIAASLVASLIVAFSSRNNKWRAYDQIASITGKSLIGAFVGGLITLPLLFLMF